MVLTKILAACLVVASLAFAACGGDDDPSPDEAQAELCSNLEELQTEVTALSELGLNSTVADIEDAFESIQGAFEEVVSSAEEVAGAETEQLSDALDSLESAVSDIGGDTPIADALAAIQDSLSSLGSAWQELFTTTDCSENAS